MAGEVYITERQERELFDRILKESLIVNSSQVAAIAKYLNSHFVASVDYCGEIGDNGLPCPSVMIYYVINGNATQQLKREELLDVLNDMFSGFIKDEPSRLAYYDQIITDWLSGKIKSTGQLSVNHITDQAVSRYKNRKKADGGEARNKSEEDEKKKARK